MYVPFKIKLHRNHPKDLGVQTLRLGIVATWVTCQLALRKAHIEGPSTTVCTQAKMEIRLHVTPCWRMQSHDASWESTVPTACNVLTKIRDSLNPELRTVRSKKGITPTAMHFQQYICCIISVYVYPVITSPHVHRSTCCVNFWCVKDIQYSSPTFCIVMIFTSLARCDCWPSKHQWSLYVPPGLTFSNTTFCPHCICVFCVDLRTNSDYFPIQH